MSTVVYSTLLATTVFITNSQLSVCGTGRLRLLTLTENCSYDGWSHEWRDNLNTSRRRVWVHLSYIASFSFDCHHTQIVNQINCQYYSLIKSTFIWPIRSLALSFRSCTEHLNGFGWLLIMSLFFIEEYASSRPCEARIHPNLGYYLLSIFALDLLDVK